MCPCGNRNTKSEESKKCSKIMEMMEDDHEMLDAVSGNSSLVDLQASDHQHLHLDVELSGDFYSSASKF